MSQRPLRVLALSPQPIEGAGCRFRIAHYIPYLNANGFDVELSPLYTNEFFRLVHKPGYIPEKAVNFTEFALRRLWSLQTLNDYDVVFLYREIFPVGPAWVERLMTKPGRPPVVFDFDDAIFLPSVSKANRMIEALKFPGKVADIIRYSTEIVAGNDYLAAYARQYNPAVTVIPTTVDTHAFTPVLHKQPDPRGLVLGWIGSPTTAEYLDPFVRVLQRLQSSGHRFVMRISGSGEPVAIDGVSVDNLPWALAREIDLFRTCDIGVYPLPDDEWSKGKCGFKAIEFMACGVPVVAARVGVNKEIITDGVDGFLASSDDEWVEKLTRLMTDPELRVRLGAAGRRTIEERYSLQVRAPQLAAVLRRAAERRGSE